MSNQEIILNGISEVVKNNKITKGNIAKFRAWYREQFNLEDSRELMLLSSDIASVCERHLDRKAANRPSFSDCATNIINFDWSTVAGCIGYERVFVGE